MRKGKLVIRIVVVIVLVLVVSAVWMYVQASRVPQSYRPARLSLEQREGAVHDFARQCQDFYNQAQRVRPFTWTVTGERLNAYLASMDEIAAELPGDIPAGAVEDGMAQAGFSGPAVALKPGVITLLIRSREYSKVLSLDLGFTFEDGHKLRVHLVDTHVGRLSLPDPMVANALAKATAAIRRWKDSADAPEQAEYGVEGPSADAVARMLATVVEAIDEDPIDTEMEVGGKRIHLTAIDITSDLLSIHAEPSDDR